MKKNFFYLVIIIIFFAGCVDGHKGKIIFGISAEYPPFEYMQNGEFRGFDIDLAKLIAKKMNKAVEFKDMQFNNLFQALNANQIDVAISMITITEEREKNFDFSIPYYFNKIGTIFYKNSKIEKIDDLHNKKLTCQLGTTMEIWIKKKLPNNELILINNINQAIELLKNHYVDVIIIDEFQSKLLAKENKNFSWAIIDSSKNGSGLVFKKHSKLTNPINTIIDELKKNGEIQKLEEKWLQ